MNYINQFVFSILLFRRQLFIYCMKQIKKKNYSFRLLFGRKYESHTKTHIYWSNFVIFCLYRANQRRQSWKKSSRTKLKRKFCIFFFMNHMTSTNVMKTNETRKIMFYLIYCQTSHFSYRNVEIFAKWIFLKQ